MWGGYSMAFGHEVYTFNRDLIAWDHPFPSSDLHFARFARRFFSSFFLLFLTVEPGPRLGTLQSDNSDVHEIVADKKTSQSLANFLRLSQVVQLLKRSKFKLELKREDRARVQADSKIYLLTVPVLKLN